MVTVREACEPGCPGMHMPLFREPEIERAEKNYSRFRRHGHSFRPTTLQLQR